jgi:hypothetical protein
MRLLVWNFRLIQRRNPIPNYLESIDIVMLGKFRENRVLLAEEESTFVQFQGVSRVDYVCGLIRIFQRPFGYQRTHFFGIFFQDRSILLRIANHALP